MAKRAGLAERFRSAALDMDAKLGVARVSDPEDVHIRDTHQQVAHARSIGFHRVSGLLALGTVGPAESLCHARDAGPRSDPKSR